MSVKAGLLRRSLVATIPAASKDGTLPGICVVHLHAGRNVLLATATDRYVAAHARCGAVDDLEPTVVQLADAKFIADWLRRLHAETEISLARDGDHLVVTDGILTLRLGTEDLGWPAKSMTSIFAGTRAKATSAGKPNPPGRLDLGRERLASLNRVLSATPRGSTTRWRMGDGLSPVLVDVDDWLLVAVMPMRIHPEDQHVMFGMPDPEPAPRARRSRKAPAFVPEPTAPQVTAARPRRKAS